MADQTQQIPALYVVYGKDRRQKAQAVEAVIDQVLAGGDPQVSLNRYEGEQAALADVLDELRTLPFLSQRRLVIVQDADGFIQTYRQGLEDYLNKPSASGVLCLVAESFAGNTRLARLAKKIATVIVCDPISPRRLAGYLKQYAQDAHRLELPAASAELLIELGGDDAGMLVSQIDKLAAYLADPATPARRIDPEAVEALVGQNRQYNAFAVIDSLTRGRLDSALGQLQRMLSQDRQAQFQVVGAFAWHFRRLYQGRIWQEQGRTDQQIVRALPVWSQQEAFMRQVRSLSLADLAGCLRRLSRIDWLSKTGGGAVQIGLETFIVDFCRRRLSVA